MVEFWIGFMVAGLVGGAFAYRCFEGREQTESRLRQTVDRLRLDLEEARLEGRRQLLAVEGEREELRDRLEVQRKRIEGLETEKFDLGERLRQAEERRKGHHA